MTNKKCAQCGQEKPIEDFSKSYKNLCKECVAENARVARQAMAYVKSQKTSMPSFYCERGMEVHIPEDATFIPPIRFQASVAAMQGLLNATSVERFTLRIKPEPLAQAAVEYADALINELKNRTMKWKPISEYDTPNADVLFRIMWDNGTTKPYYIMGWISEDNDLYTHEDPNGISGGFKFNINAMHLYERKIKSIHFVDPKEIEL